MDSIDDLPDILGTNMEVSSLAFISLRQNRIPSEHLLFGSLVRLMHGLLMLHVAWMLFMKMEF
jgi:hypothetical protein